MIGNNKNTRNKFELVLVVRDKEGNPTGQKRAVSTDNVSEVSKLYEGNSRRDKRRNKRNKRNKRNN